MTAPFRPRMPIVPALLAAIGASLALHYGDRWYGYEPLAGAALEQSVELNYAFDLAREGLRPPLPAGDAARRKAAIRHELQEEDAQQRRDILAPLGAGLMLLVLGGSLWLGRALQERS